MAATLSNPDLRMRPLNGSDEEKARQSSTTAEKIKEKWLGCQDSNLGMAIPKTAALPLGDTPTRSPE
jgi:hypothetical protein